MPWEHVGIAAVDSGCMWVGDPCYIFHTEEPVKDIGKNWGSFCRIIEDQDMRQFNFNLGHPGLGVLVSHFGGDGVYPVEVLRGEDGLVKGVRVMFDYDEEAS